MFNWKKAALFSLVVLSLFTLPFSLSTRPLSLVPRAYAAGHAVTSEVLTVSSVPVRPTQSKYFSPSSQWTGQTATAAWVCVEGADVRITEDGTTPVAGAWGSAGTGPYIYAGQCTYIRGGSNIANLQFIAATSGQTARVQDVYYFGGE